MAQANSTKAGIVAGRSPYQPAAKERLLERLEVSSVRVDEDGGIAIRLDHVHQDVASDAWLEIRVDAATVAEARREGVVYG